jgi:ribosomal protein L37AE/L43A
MKKIMKKCECPCTIVFGPGDDDYGRDNIIEEWECPGCHKTTPFTHREIRSGIYECPKCHWRSEYGQKIHDLVDSIAKIKKKAEPESGDNP